MYIYMLRDALASLFELPVRIPELFPKFSRKSQNYSLNFQGCPRIINSVQNHS